LILSDGFRVFGLLVHATAHILTNMMRTFFFQLHSRWELTTIPTESNRRTTKCNLITLFAVHSILSNVVATTDRLKAIFGIYSANRHLSDNHSLAGRKMEDIRELGNTAQEYGGLYSGMYGRITVCTAYPRPSSSAISVSGQIQNPLVMISGNGCPNLSILSRRNCITESRVQSFSASLRGC